MRKDLPIGLLDSGVGGLSVLRTAVEIMPNENYLYYGDSANAPYGGKTPQEIRKHVFAGVDVLLNYGIKALVLACNTATAVTVEELRERLDIPVIGMEPAVKPAISYADKDPVLVIATPATLSLPKFGKLVKELHAEDEIISLPAPKLAKLVDAGDQSEITAYLHELVVPFRGRVSAIVLGCTHYVFCKELIEDIMPDIPIIHGNVGTVEHLRDVLKELDLINPNSEKGKITLMSSAGEEKARQYERFLK